MNNKTFFIFSVILWGFMTICCGIMIFFLIGFAFSHSWLAVVINLVNFTIITSLAFDISSFLDRDVQIMEENETPDSNYLESLLS